MGRCASRDKPHIPPSNQFGVDDAVQPIVAAAQETSWDRVAGRSFCDPCLGRAFGKVGTGLTNRERGRAIRDRVAPPLVLGPCSLCAGLMDDLDRYAALAAAKLAPWEFRTFLVGSRIDSEVAAREEALWAEIAAASPEPIRAEVNREIGKLLAARTGRDVDFLRPDVVVLVDTAFDVVEIQVNSILFYGRYRKLARGIPQTRWPCRTCRGKGCERCGGLGKMYATSVEEIVAQAVMAQTGGRGTALHGMGREDVDARMLGRGRPFLLEIKEPIRRTVDLDAVGTRVSASGQVEVDGLRPATVDEVPALKDDRAEKTYRALVALDAPVEDGKLLKALSTLVARPIAQRTPTRVSHRRADRQRERRVRSCDMVRRDGPLLELTIRAEAGTYVKELLHGDGGRTEPSLASLLGVGCTVREIDVLDVHDSR